MRSNTWIMIIGIAVVALVVVLLTGNLAVKTEAVTSATNAIRGAAAALPKI